VRPTRRRRLRLTPFHGFGAAARYADATILTDDDDPDRRVEDPE